MSPSLPAPLRGEIWWLNLSPTQGREQYGARPGLVVSVDQLNRGPAELVIVVPLTSQGKGIPSQVRIVPPEAGLTAVSWAMVEQVRSVFRGRFTTKIGDVTPATLQQVEVILRRLLGL